MDDLDKVLQALSLDTSGIVRQFNSLPSVFHLVLAALMGFLVLLTYFAQSAREERDKNLAYVLPVLSVLMAVIMRIEGFQIAVFFGIFGILSIVRFRSDLTDQKGITFLLFSVIEGVLIGVNAFTLAILAWLVASAVILIARKIFVPRPLYRLTVRFDTSLLEARERIESQLTSNKMIWHLASYQHELEQNGKKGLWEQKHRLEYVLTPKHEEELFTVLPSLTTIFQSWQYEIEVKRSGETV